MLIKSVELVPQRDVGVIFGSRSGGELMGKRGHRPHGMDAATKGSECKFLFSFHFVKLNLNTSGTGTSSTRRPFPLLWQCKMTSRVQVTFLFPLNLLPWLQRDLVLHKQGSDSSSRYNMKYSGCGIMPSSCCLGNSIIIIILLFNFLTSWRLIFQPELCIHFCLSHHLVISYERGRG